VRKVNFRFVALHGNFKDNIGTNPFGFVFDKVEVVVQDVPHDFLVRYKFGDPECGAVNILIAVLKLSTEFVGISHNGL